MNKYGVIALAGVLLGGAIPAGAYDPLTHQALSQEAYNASTLVTNPGILDSLGLPPLSTVPKFPNSQLFAKQREIVELFRDGAEFEDDFPRSANHFFDPLTGQGLAVGSPSPDWAIDGTGDSSTIKFSFKAAREYLWQATANPLNNYDYRQTQFGLMFRSIGQVIHHIQDMAQPQHVRNDQHCDIRPCYLIGAYNPSAYEQYTKTAPNLPYTNLDYNASTQIKFDTARQFWTTTVNGNGNTGQGMAEFTNRNFVSAGTNFTPQNGVASPSSRYQSPKLNGASSVADVATLFTAAGKPVPAGCTDVLNPCTLTFYASDVTDSLLGKTYVNERATTRSMFDDFLVASGKTITYTDPDTGQLITTDRLFALNQFNFDAAHQFLIPRAVSYSAGLINYFFRGKMQIALPDEGVYALVDHADAKFTHIDPLTDFIGFNKIKLKLSSTTPGNEAMSGGKLLAVLKFRRNTCYQDNLSGYPPLVSWDTCRNAEEEIVVSDPANGGANVVLSSTPQPFEFNFPKALPLNAIDVYLQVIYRGTLGQEADAVVVATQDISEPTFFSSINLKDYIFVKGEVHTRDEINASSTLLDAVTPLSCVVSSPAPRHLADSCFTPDTISDSYSLGTKPTVFGVTQLPVGRFMRVVFLADTSPVTFTRNSSVISGSFDENVLKWQNTYDAASNTITHSYPTFYKFRGIYDRQFGPYNAYAIWVGGVIPGSQYDWRSKMSDLIIKTPLAVTINNGGGF